MKIRYCLNTLFLLVLLGAAAAADAQVQPQLADRYFKEATTLCERDAGRLWGVSLCGPMVIVDQATGTRATSQPEPAGPPPRFPGFVDGPVSWGGQGGVSFPLAMLPPADAHRAAASELAAGEAQPSFVGNFEAASGPAYGVLLDDLLPGWRRQVRGTSDLGDMLASATTSTTPDVAVAAARYDGATLRT